jgi:LmbE family N-acetylglucosaminyl deacetylase
VYAHVADSACEASGTMAVHVDRGDEVTVVIASDGERHHAALFLDEQEAPGRGDIPFLRADLEAIRALKRREAERAMAIIGVRDVVFLGWPDEDLAVGHERVRELAAVILRVRPDLLVTHLPRHTYGGDVDPHAAVGAGVLRAEQLAASRMRQIDGVPMHAVHERMFFPQGELADSRDPLNPGLVADVWVDITPVIDRKVRAMDQIVSQAYHGAAARKIVESREGRWGMLSGVSYAEPFVRGGRTYSALPMPEGWRERVFVPNDLPGDRVIAVDVPSAVPEDAFRLPG